MIDSKLTVSKGLRCLKKVHMLDSKVIGEKKIVTYDLQSWS